MPSVQVVPQGIQSVNGSDINMGCVSSLADIGDVVNPMTLKVIITW